MSSNEMNSEEKKQEVKSKRVGTFKTKDSVPEVRLTAKQIEEIHACEYSLLLFYATRIKPLSIFEIKKQYPEPTALKAQSVLDRLIEVELIHKTNDDKFYSNFPKDYVNYSDYKYDHILEGKKDSKIFDLMKQYNGKEEYWEKNAYFSMDFFFSEEQTKEINKMFKAIRKKSKKFMNENMKKKDVSGLNFRRMKYYNIQFLFALILGVSLFSLSLPGFCGGNDPGGGKNKRSIVRSFLTPISIEKSSGGNDPGGKFIPDYVDPSPEGGGHDPDPSTMGGGHDPDPKKALYNDLLGSLRNCEILGNDFCETTFFEIQKLKDSMESQGQ